jgi:hypothetical protein
MTPRSIQSPGPDHPTGIEPKPRRVFVEVAAQGTNR